MVAAKATQQAVPAAPASRSAMSKQLTRLLGVPASRTPPDSKVEVHELLVRKGLPYAALFQLVQVNKAIPEHDLAEAVGISTRTLRRARQNPETPMPADLASKTWLLAETLGKATSVLGGKEAAQQWLIEPQTGLDGRRPIDLLRTVQGAEVVTAFLGRLEYGVYN